MNIEESIASGRISTNYLVKPLRLYAQLRYDEEGTYWDWLNECHSDKELMEEFITPSGCYKLEDLVKCKQIKDFFKIMGIKESNSCWNQ